MGMKPIFEEERQFIKKKSGVEIPEGCWRDASKIYLDCTQDEPMYRIKVHNMQLSVQRTRFQPPAQRTLSDLIEDNKDRLDHLMEWSCSALQNTVLEKPNHFYLIGYSGGKDSELTYYIWQQVLARLQDNHPEVYQHLQWGINFANTTNDTADTYRRLKTLPQDKLNILNPTIGFHKWVTEIKKYKTPTVLMRNCCSTYKEGQIYSAYDKNQPMVQVLGLRRHESTKRAEYQYEMGADFYADLYGHRNTPAAWITVAPLIDWTDVDVWLFLLRENMDFNRQYRLGFNRCGCLVCPYQTAYVDLLIAEHYPKAWSRWVEILKKGYEQMHVAQNFKWTLEEWINGQWKEGKSKERSLLILKPTPKRVQELAQLKGISEAMAKKYWNRNCRDCNKKLTSTEVAMFFKLHGRLEEVEDDQRPMQCRKCYCAETGMKTKEYSKMVLQFVDEGCNLF